MPTYDEIQALLETARERAATEVDAYIPEKQGDHISGVVEELGTITTKFGDYYTTTIRVFGTVAGTFADGRAEDTPDWEGKLVRVAWMGAVLQSTFLRMRPTADDLVAFHYQKDVQGGNGMNPYALVVAVVLDGNTGKAKVPVDLAVAQVTAEQIQNSDPLTGEIPPAPVQVGRSPLEPIPGEEPL